MMMCKEMGEAQPAYRANYIQSVPEYNRGPSMARLKGEKIRAPNLWTG